LGTAILKQLLKEAVKSQVVGIARSPEKAQNIGVEIRKGDYNLYEDFRNALTDIEVLILISGMDHPDRRIEQHRNVIQAAKDSGVRKIVYSSIIGYPGENQFKPVILSNRQTEKDLMLSGLDWVIGRNGIYIEPDLDYVNEYRKAGQIINSAGEGRCAYTSRAELACAFTQMAMNDAHNDNNYNLAGRSLTQYALAILINEVYGMDITYKPISAEAYYADRIEHLGEYLGGVIGGIYEGIQQGLFHPTSDFRIAAGRPHLTPLEMIQQYKESQDL
jgi:NAD(P)H dehydrogenase (quinone)